ncbi:hypothetical protein Patl1_16303 [Pistacia atlantica]|uniref:Uncharacterized protein n=1 Tax=Pistacia atlantica TaxID=434234 RepID=A0ACC1B5X5_9ROSI|nr:hypothetical protein Patl1_16303 [Pistacia atlantica]
MLAISKFWKTNTSKYQQVFGHAIRTNNCLKKYFHYFQALHAPKQTEISLKQVINFQHD